MSDNTARVPTLPAPRALQLGAGESRRLRLLVPDIARRSVPFSVVCIGMLVLGLVGVLLLNILISHSSYRAEELTATQQELHAERERLEEDISYKESPQNIAAAAEAQGMERDNSPQYIRLSDGKIVDIGEVPGRTKVDNGSVPGPRADTREAVRPNLRSSEVLPAVGGSSDPLPAPAQRAPN